MTNKMPDYKSGIFFNGDEHRKLRSLGCVQLRFTCAKAYPVKSPGLSAWACREFFKSGTRLPTVLFKFRMVRNKFPGQATLSFLTLSWYRLF
jgi:hypothetical protein